MCTLTYKIETSQQREKGSTVFKLPGPCEGNNHCVVILCDGGVCLRKIGNSTDVVECVATLPVKATFGKCTAEVIKQMMPELVNIGNFEDICDAISKKLHLTEYPSEVSEKCDNTNSLDVYFPEKLRDHRNNTPVLIEWKPLSAERRRVIFLVDGTILLTMRKPVLLESTDVLYTIINREYIKDENAVQNVASHIMRMLNKETNVAELHECVKHAFSLLDKYGPSLKQKLDQTDVATLSKMRSNILTQMTNTYGLADEVLAEALRSNLCKVLAQLNTILS